MKLTTKIMILNDFAARLISINSLIKFSHLIFSMLLQVQRRLSSASTRHIKRDRRPRADAKRSTRISSTAPALPKESIRRLSLPECLRSDPRYVKHQRAQIEATNLFCGNLFKWILTRGRKNMNIKREWGVTFSRSTFNYKQKLDCDKND